jgi:hypothetical protein
MLIRGIVVLTAAAVSGVSHAQFTCTLTNTDEDAFFNSKGDSNDHCVWCNVAGFGGCMSEKQAEK